MKINILLLLFISYPSHSAINLDECISRKGDTGQIMLSVMSDDFNINKSIVDEGKTQVKIISARPVTFPLAIFYGNKEKVLSGINSDDPTTAEKYAEGFMKDNVKNFILQYDFKSKKGMENILLASAFISEVECIVRFNGYIIVKREF